MDYSKLSNFSINLLVAHAYLGEGNYDQNVEKEEVYLAGMDGGDFLPHAFFNPCNNPADAWPIVVENGIGFHKQLNGLWCVTNRLGKYPQYSVEPLRAAMIVYLMMNEVSDESECILRKNTKHNA